MSPREQAVRDGLIRPAGTFTREEPDRGVAVLRMTAHDRALAEARARANLERDRQDPAGALQRQKDALRAIYVEGARLAGGG
jgi:hypothetical protein